MSRGSSKLPATVELRAVGKPTEPDFHTARDVSVCAAGDPSQHDNARRRERGQGGARKPLQRKPSRARPSSREYDIAVALHSRSHSCPVEALGTPVRYAVGQACSGMR